MVAFRYRYRTGEGYRAENESETKKGMVLNMINFSENFKRYRREAGMNQDELASAMGVTPQAVSKWECGLSLPDVTLLIPISELFGITVDELLRGEGTAREVTVAVTQPSVNRETVLDADGILKDDGVMRIVRCIGKRVLDANEKNDFKIPIEFPEELGDRIVNVEIYGGVIGDVSSNGTVNCGSVGGDVSSNGTVNCGGVGGDVNSNGNVHCGGVEGVVDTVGNVTCGAVRKGVGAVGNVTCGGVEGNVEAGGDVRCCNVNGSIRATTVTCERIEGDVEAQTVNYK